MQELDVQVQTSWTRDIIALAESRGADADALWRAAGGAAEQMGETIEEAAHLRVWETIMRALMDPGFPMRVAAQRNVDQYALLGLACKTSSTVREAIGHLIRVTTVWRKHYVCILQDVEGGANLMLEGPTGGALAAVVRMSPRWRKSSR